MTKPIDKGGSHKARSLYMLLPWEAQHFVDYSILSAYVEASGEFERTATIHRTSGASAETLAAYLLDVINDTHRNRPVLADAISALELVLEEERLSLTSEQAVDAILSRIRKRI